MYSECECVCGSLFVLFFLFYLMGGSPVLDGRILSTRVVAPSRARPWPNLPPGRMLSAHIRSMLVREREQVLWCRSKLQLGSVPGQEESRLMSCRRPAPGARLAAGQ